MQKYTNNVTDLRGNALVGATITVTVTSGGATATLYSDNGVTPLSNPVSTDSEGEFFFYAANNKYTLTTTYNGSTVAVTDIVLFDPSDSTASGDVGFTQSGTGAVATTVQAALRAIAKTPEQYGAVGDGVADDTTAVINAATAAKILYLPNTYKLTSQLDLTGTNCSVIFGAGSYLSGFVKAFNGEAIKCDSSGVVMRDFYITGNGATYTGGGIYPRGYNIKITHIRITDTQDSPIIVEGAVGTNATAATYLSVDSCFLTATSSSTYAVRSTTADDSARPTSRVFSNISGGAPLIDFSGMNYAILENSLGTLIKFDANSSKVVMKGNRLTNAAANITVYGVDHVIDHNLWGFGSGFGVTIYSTASNVFWGDMNNILEGSSANKSPSIGYAEGAAFTSNIHTNRLTYVPKWYGTTTNETLGNGTRSGSYKLSGRKMDVNIYLVRGSTDVNPTGTWSLQLPFKVANDSYGTALVKSSTGTYYSCVVLAVGGTSAITIYRNGDTAAVTDATMAFGTNGAMQIAISCILASS